MKVSSSLGFFLFILGVAMPALVYWGAAWPRVTRPVEWASKAEANGRLLRLLVPGLMALVVAVIYVLWCDWPSSIYTPLLHGTLFVMFWGVAASIAAKVALHALWPHAFMRHVALIHWVSVSLGCVLSATLVLFLSSR